MRNRLHLSVLSLLTFYLAISPDVHAFRSAARKAIQYEKVTNKRLLNKVSTNPFLFRLSYTWTGLLNRKKIESNLAKFFSGTSLRSGELSINDLKALNLNKSMQKNYQLNRALSIQKAYRGVVIQDGKTELLKGNHFFNYVRDGIVTLSEGVVLGKSYTSDAKKKNASKLPRQHYLFRHFLPFRPIQINKQSQVTVSNVVDSSPLQSNQVKKVIPEIKRVFIFPGYQESIHSYDDVINAHLKKGYEVLIFAQEWVDPLHKKGGTGNVTNVASVALTTMIGATIAQNLGGKNFILASSMSGGRGVMAAKLSANHKTFADEKAMIRIARITYGKLPLNHGFPLAEKMDFALKAGQAYTGGGFNSQTLKEPKPLKIALSNPYLKITSSITNKLLSWGTWTIWKLGSGSLRIPVLVALPQLFGKDNTEAKRALNEDIVTNRTRITAAALHSTNKEMGKYLNKILEQELWADSVLKILVDEKDPLADGSSASSLGNEANIRVYERSTGDHVTQLDEAGQRILGQMVKDFDSVEVSE